MPRLSGKWYFDPRPSDEHDGDEARYDDRYDEPESGLSYVPAGLRRRHGARVLDPGSAAEVYERPEPVPAEHRARAPRSTVYRARTLLIPADLLRNPAVVEAINEVLAGVGMSVAVPGRDGRGPRCGGRPAEVLRRLPRPVVLVPAAPENGRPSRPTVVDAWTALQALRAAAAAADDDAVLSKRVVRRIALEHLLVGSAISGSPSSEGHPLTGPESTDSYVYGGDTRVPVAVCLDPPARRSLENCGSRRPVVAVLDTGVRAHPWLDVDPDPVHRYRTVPDGFVAVDDAIQDAIYAEGEETASLGDRPRHLIRKPWDTTVTEDPLIGELDEASGHGTFIAGIVRQVAPDARVLSVRIMHSDDVVAEGDLLCALTQIADRVASAQAGHMEEMVDVVSLSLGYFSESADDLRYSSGLWQVIELLLSMGVAVVASAGNFSTGRRCYPAAFALLPPPGPVPVISVGALNPNGSKALFSDDGYWVRAWATGAAVVSTYPADINGSRTAQIEVPAAHREALDPDDYSGGFAVWSGTSFSAPLVAALIAAQLLRDAADPALALGEPGAEAAMRRMSTALKRIPRQG